jgi:hypothetical protein
MLSENIMESYYECKRCFYKTKYKNDMRRHLNNKNICKKKNILCNLTNEQLYELSFIKKKTVFEEKEKENDNKFICEHCNKSFSRNYNLKVHQENRCKKNSMKDELNNNITNYNTLNTTNNTLNTTNNNIMVNILCNPFENKFDISHIDQLTKMDLIINIIYTKALEHILENKNNLNLLLEDDHETAVLYKNEKEKFVRMNKSEFTKNIMQNMKNTLSYMNDETAKNPYLTERIDEIINLKYNKYTEEKQTNDIVNDMICKIYDQKKAEVQEVFKNINNSEDLIIY